MLIVPHSEHTTSSFLAHFSHAFFCSFTKFNYHTIYVVFMQWLVTDSVIIKTWCVAIIGTTFWRLPVDQHVMFRCVNAPFHFSNINLLTGLCKSTCVILLSFLSPPRYLLLTALSSSLSSLLSSPCPPYFYLFLTASTGRPSIHESTGTNPSIVWNRMGWIPRWSR